MAQGLDLVIAISNGVARLPHANMVAAQPPTFAIVVLSAGLVLLCLLAGPVRLAGLALMLAGGLMTLIPQKRPDILVERTGQNVAIRTAEELLVPALARRSRFTVEKWLQANGEEATPAEAAARSGWTCSEGVCRAEVKGKRVVFLRGLEGKAVNCPETDVLIADFPLRGGCRHLPLRIDRFDLWRNGAYAVQIGDAGFSVTTARVERGDRPWVVVPERRATPYVRLPPQDENSLD